MLIRKALSLLLCLCLLASLSAPAFADNGTVTGKWGNLTWTVDTDGLLTISGTGPMKDFNGYSQEAWRGLSMQINAVVIKPGVTSIGAYAFSGLYLTRVSVPSGVTSIGDYAFSGSKLPELALPQSVSSIGRDAFAWCEELTGIALPSRMAYLGERAFYNCYRLTSVVIPEGIKKIENSCFYQCGGLKSVSLPSTLVQIDENAFYGCSITELSLPSGLKRIGDFAFFACRTLHACSFPESLESIGAYAFYCAGIEPLNLPEKLTRIADGAFYGNTSLKSLTIPAAVSRIGSYAFSDCSNLESVTIPAAVTSIGDSAFSYCTRLSDVYYLGQTSQWNAIQIGTENQPLTSAALHISGSIPKFSRHPQSVTVRPGEKAVFSADAYTDNGDALEAQWQFREAGSEDWWDIDGETGWSLSFYAYARDSGSQYRCVVTCRSDSVVSNAATLTVKEAEEDSYTVRYHANGGSGAPAAQTKTPGAALTLSALVPKRAGWYFVGWAEQSGASAAYLPGGRYTKGANVTLYAVWAQPDFTLPANTILVEESAFENCAFRFAALSEKTQELRNAAFRGCGKLRYVYIPEACKTIHKSAFDSGSALTVLGARGSRAESYAAENGFSFIAIG